VSSNLWEIYGDTAYHPSCYSDLGSRLAAARVSGYITGPHNEDALKVAKEWMKEQTKPNMVIVGPIDSGKSYLAACMYNTMLSRGESVVWVNAASLMAQIKRGFSDKDTATETNTRIRVAESVTVLFLDDLGKVHPGKDVSYTEEVFYSIIDARYRNELATVVTTEWKADALAERVGESVVSRLMHGAFVAGIKPPAAPYRKRAE
jgi:DNA replication protein DnaC